MVQNELLREYQQRIDAQALGGLQDQEDHQVAANSNQLAVVLLRVEERIGYVVGQMTALVAWAEEQREDKVAEKVKHELQAQTKTRYRFVGCCVGIALLWVASIWAAHLLFVVNSAKGHRNHRLCESS
ncbi:MAG: hypothetical protein M1833_000488 [Piccolia ochrophora]|nr:MAG: hypothetical protein M1833_000488 [Piccolia ochrophora]